MQKVKGIFPFLIIFTMIIVVTLAGLWIYNSDLKRDLEEETHKTLDEILAQQKFNFKSEVDAKIETIVTNATMISYIEGDYEKIVRAMNDIGAKTKFEFLIIADTKGKSINSNGEVVNVSGRPYYERAINGETFMPEPVKSLISEDFIIPISTPIIRNGETLGILAGAVSTSRLDDLLLPAYNGMGYTFVVNNKGDIIAKTKNDGTHVTTSNLFESWITANATFYKFDNLETIMKNIELGESGHSTHRIEDETQIIHYSPVGVNDWYIFVVVSEDIVSKNAANITDKAAILATLIIFCFTVFIICIFLIQNKSSKAEAENIRRLEQIAYVDELTGTGNYNKFKIDAQQILQKSVNTSYIIIKADVENFKLINKIYGFEMGNHVLQVIAASIKTIFAQDGGIFARLAIDDFVILHHFGGKEKYIDMHNAFINKFYEMMGKDFDYRVKFKIGQCVIDKEQAAKVDITELFEMANFAHRKAKQSTVVDLVFYDESMSKDALYQKGIENKMEKALANNEFIVYLQPKYRLIDERIGGAEALARWNPTDCQMILPNEFIPIFEKNGFVTKLDMYILTRVCSLIKGWIDAGIQPVIVSVNFSRLHLGNNSFVDNLCKIVDSYDIPRRYLEIEITESAIFENLKKFEEVLLELHNSGFTLSMDDFGSGYSSLGLLKNLPVDVIKIDRSFFVSQKNEQRTRTVISNVIRMANQLSISTVAEGVEEQKHVDLLRELGCDMVQGYYYAKPMTEKDFTKKIFTNHVE